MNTRGTTRLDTWLSRLLIALIRRFGGDGGEVRISTEELEDAQGRFILFTDYDKAKHELVLRFGTGAAEAIVVNTEQQWAERTTPANSTVSSEATNRGSVVHSDSDLARIEASLLERARQRQRTREEQDRLAARRAIMQE